MPSFSTPGRTATLRRQQNDRQAVPLTAYPYTDPVGGGGVSAATGSSSLFTGGGDCGGGGGGGDYKACGSSVPLIADIPAPRQFKDPHQHHQQQPEHQRGLRQDVITC